MDGVSFRGLPTRLPARSSLPSTAVLEMTYACNHHCIYCSCPWENPAGSFPRLPEMSPEEWKQLIEVLLRDHGVNRLAFTGGEPTLKQGLRDIIRFAASLKAEFVQQDDQGNLHREERAPDLYVISNGRNLDPSWVPFFVENRIHVSVSLPGLSTYGGHTQAGKAEDALAWIKTISDTGLHVTVNVTVTKVNIFELYETIGTALLHGADFLLMNRFLPGGRGLAHADRLRLSGEEVRSAIRTAEEALTTANRPGSLGTEVPKCLVADIPTQKLKVGTTCSAARDFFAVDPSGRLRTCNHSPVLLGHWHDIPAILRSDYWKRFVFKKFLPPGCRGCDLLSSCDAGCREAAHIEGGDLQAPDTVLPGGRDWRLSNNGPCLISGGQPPPTS